ncbi:hypothetical protein, variant [Verruconis gallopava]|nr:hypothetical protein, variant [Verruconis gallopava]KIW00307.1 hypothetical protein, variant [Verruconis gallopava]
MAESLDTLPPVSTLPSLPTSTRAQILDLLFEPSQALHTLSLPLTSTESTHSFRTYDDLIAAIGIQLTELAESASTSDTEWLEQILGSHPRLGEKKVDSKLSRMEQAAMAKASGDQRSEAEIAAEMETLAKLNAEYEARFPGLRYV